MKYFLSLLLTLISMPSFTEDFKCPQDTLLIDFVSSSSQERMQVCQKKVDGKYLNHGPEIIYNRDGTIKSKNYYEMGVLTPFEKINLQKIKSENEPNLDKFPNESKQQDSIITGFSTTCAIIKNVLKCWGSNFDNTIILNRLNPKVEPWGSSNIQSVSLSRLTPNINFGCFIMNGEAQCLGANPEGQLGNGTTSDLATPMKVLGLSTNVQALSSGGSYTCAIDNGGVKCWGANYLGWLGDGTKIKKLVPTQVLGLTSGVRAISAGISHACALIKDGVVCWGNNSNGQLGDGTTKERLIPTKVVGLGTNVQAISVGENYSCAIVSGSVKCWGMNAYGQLGDGTNETRFIPTTVNGLSSGVQAISSGISHACALMDSGSVKCWGSNISNQIGNSNKAIHQLIPSQVSGLTSKIKAISVGAAYTCALMNNSNIQCWGQNAAGQLGDGTTINRQTPTQVIGF